MKRIARKKAGACSVSQGPDNAYGNEAMSSSTDTSFGNQVKVCQFDQLSGDILTKIFKLLDLDDLIKLRQVCHKWGRLLVTSEKFWENSQLYYETDDYGSCSKANFMKCWRMAPVLHRATFDLSWREKTDFPKRLLQKCPLSVKSLHFSYDNMPPETMFQLFKQYQDTVEELMINDSYTPYVESDVRRLWKEIQSLTKLKHLIIDGAALLYHKATLLKAKPCWETLRVLDVKDSSYEDMNTVQKIISIHQNWTNVYLSSNITLARAEVKAVAKCTNLECLQMPFCKEFKLLLNLEKLDSLIIECNDDTEDEVQEVVSAMKKKLSCLPNLTALKLIGGNSTHASLLMSLLKGRPKLSLLNLVNLEMGASEFLEVLKCASGLEKLFLHEVGSDLLAPILNELSNGLMPTLKKVVLMECDCQEECIRVCVNQFNRKQLPVKIVTDCNCTGAD